MRDLPENSTESQAAPRKMSLTRSVVFAAMIGFGVVSFWRGVWYLWDVFTFTQEEHRLASALASMITGILILSVMRTFYSVLAPPIHRLNIR